MIEVPTFVWIVAGIATAFAILGFVSALAAETGHETGVHLLRKQVVELRCQYLRSMIESFGLTEPDDSIEVEIADARPPGQGMGDEEAQEQAAAA